jgi:hypothetical protein
MSIVKKPSALLQVAELLQRARKLPVGAARNDLRQFARSLLKLYRTGIEVDARIIEQLTPSASHAADQEKPAYATSGSADGADSNPARSSETSSFS